MTNTDQHILIYEILKSQGKNPDKVLENNDLENFNECIIGKNDSIRTKKGHLLRGLSGNPTGRSKEVVKEQKESKERIRTMVQSVKEQILEEYKDYEKKWVSKGRWIAATITTGCAGLTYRNLIEKGRKFKNVRLIPRLCYPEKPKRPLIKPHARTLGNSKPRKKAKKKRARRL